MRCITSAIPTASARSCQRQVVDEVKRLNGMLAEERVDPEIPRGSRSTKWPSRCRPACRSSRDFSKESQANAGNVWREAARRRLLRLELPAGPPPGRTGRALHPVVSSRWDHHGDIERAMPSAARETDQASAALMQDLKQRGMLDDTLVIWGGEFGRTPMGQGTGRDHHILGFSLFLAGGGIKGGITHGQRTNSAIVPCKTSFPCTTSTPRCSSFAASITRASRSSSKDWTQS